MLQVHMLRKIDWIFGPYCCSCRRERLCGLIGLGSNDDQRRVELLYCSLARFDINSEVLEKHIEFSYFA